MENSQLRWFEDHIYLKITIKIYQIPRLFQILDKMLKFSDLFDQFSNSLTFPGFPGSVVTLFKHKFILLENCIEDDIKKLYVN